MGLRDLKLDRPRIKAAIIFRDQFKQSRGSQMQMTFGLRSINAPLCLARTPRADSLSCLRLGERKWNDVQSCGETSIGVHKDVRMATKSRDQAKVRRPIGPKTISENILGAIGRPI
jgi:hypothetical protein